MNGIRRRLSLALTLAGLGLAAAAPGALAAPSVTVTPTPTGLDPAAETTLTVSGSGFASGGVGIYVAFGPTDGGSQDAGAYYQAKWIRPAMMGGSGDTLLANDGTFTTTIPATRAYGTGDGAVDCYERACGVVTMAAHGSPDRSQDTATPVSFAPTLTATPTTGLDGAGEDVAITGAGFNGYADATHGMYVAQAAVVDGAVVTGPSVQVSPNPDTPTKWKLETDGSLAGTLRVTGTFTPRGGTTPVDCRDVQCELVTFKARTNPTPGALFTREDLSFDPVPELQLDPTEDLDAAGDAIAVEGTGFGAVADPAHGMYVAQAAIVDGAVVTGPSVQVSPNPDTPTKWKLEADGSFAGTLDVTGSFTPRGGTTPVDCRVVQCEIVTFKARTNPTVATLFTREDIAFANPTLVADPTTDLDPAGDAVAISGSGFSHAADPAHGLYVAQAAVVDGAVLTGPSAQVSPNPDTPTKWKLEADGSFAGTLTVTGSFTPRGSATPVDCKVVQCEIVTFKARTNPTEATLFTREDLAFEPVPALVLDKTTNLVAAGDAIAVSGSEFGEAADPAHGLYVAQAAVVDGAVLTGPSAQVSPNPDTPTKWKLEADGSFAGTLTVTGTFTPRGSSTAVDCRVVQCEIVTFKARTNPTVATLFTRDDIAFAADPGPGPTGASLSVSQTSGLPTDGPSTVTVTGANYPADAPGLYVVYGPAAGNQDQGAYHADAKFLPSSTIPNGSFSVSLTVAPTYTNSNGQVVNCTVVQCYVQTMRAHGTGDPNGAWSRAVPISFGSTVETPEPDPVTPAPVTPTVPVGPGGGEAPSGNPAAPAPVLRRVSVGEDGRASLRVNEASTVTFEVRRKVGKTWKLVKTIEVEIDGAGQVSSALPLDRAGRYRVTISAVGKASGVASEPIVEKVRVQAEKPAGKKAKGEKAKGEKAGGEKAKGEKAKGEKAGGEQGSGKKGKAGKGKAGTGRAA